MLHQKLNDLKTVPMACESANKLTNLWNWINENETNINNSNNRTTSSTFISPKLVAQYTEESGFGLYRDANEKLIANEAFIKLPKHILLNFVTCLKHIIAWQETEVTDEVNDSRTTKQFDSSFEYREIKVPLTYYQKFHKNSLKPQHVANSEQNIREQIYKKLNKETLINLSSFQLVGMFLALERQRRDASFWHPFVDVLPASLDSFIGIPLTWEFVNKRNGLKFDDKMLMEKSASGLQKLNAYRLVGVDDLEITHEANEKIQFQNPLIGLLPFSAQVHVKKQYHNFTNDYLTVLGLLNKSSSINLDELQSQYFSIEEFLWSWLCINSRCIYMKLPDSLPNKCIADNFTLCPLADFINHCDNSHQDSCHVRIDHSGFTAYASQTNPNSDGHLNINRENLREIFFSYGPHANAFLLCEYGFVLKDTNQWEVVDISPNILSQLSNDQKQFLKQYDYLGDYTIDHNDISFRTTIALSLLSCADYGKTEAQQFRQVELLINGMIDESRFEKRNGTILSSILQRNVQHAKLLTASLEREDTDSKWEYPRSAIIELYKHQIEVCEKWIA